MMKTIIGWLDSMNYKDKVVATFIYEDGDKEEFIVKLGQVITLKGGKKIKIKNDLGLEECK